MGLSVGQAAAESGLPTKTVRYYADIGLVAPSGRTESGYRVYDGPEVQKLVLVRRARAFGFSIDECRELLGLYADAFRASADVKKIAARRVADLTEKMRELEALRDVLAALVEACDGDERPDCPIIASLAR